MTPFGIGRSRRGSRPSASEKPILAVDIDGVVSLLGSEEGASEPLTEMALVGGAMHCVSLEAGERLRELEESFEIVWASGWERRSTELGRQLQLPEYPYLTFKGAARFGSAHWKAAPLERFARGRPVAWVDDSFDERCYEWARSRSAPTLLIEVEAHLGLRQVHAEALTAWARSLAADAGG